METAGYRMSNQARSVLMVAIPLAGCAWPAWAAGAAPAAALEDTLVCDVPFQRSLSSGEVAGMTVPAAGGEILSFIVVAVDPSDPGFYPEWRMVDASGNPAADCGLWTDARWGDCGPLEQEGSPYHLEVRDRSQGASGTVRIHLQRLTDRYACEGVPMNCGDFLLEPINDPTDTDLVRLFFAPDDVVTISVTNWDPPGPDFSPEWRLLQADGRPAPGCGTWISDQALECGPLAADGNPYRIEVRDVGEDFFGIGHVSVTGCARNTGISDPMAGGDSSTGLRLEVSNPTSRVHTGGIPLVFAIPTAEIVTVEAFQASGRLIGTPVHGWYPAGVHTLAWRAGELVPGVYFLRMRAGGEMRVTSLAVVP